ncbi:MAG: family oxidoreductase [Paenibacillus sp.]|jgi:hypothetical protein|nr:family oxidoreductase [Paenibacillus sp.]
MQLKSFGQSPICILWNTLKVTNSDGRMIMYLNYGKVTKCEDIPIQAPLQYQPQQPGIESIMIPRPVSENPNMSMAMLRNRKPESSR